MRTHVFSFLFVSAIAVACGGSVAQEITTVQGSKPVGSLTADEAKKLCEDTKAYLQRSLSEAEVRIKCQSQAISAGMGDPCRQAFARCMASPPPSGGAPFGVEWSCANPMIDARCKDVTVEELSACLRDVAEVYKGLTGRLPACTTEEARSLEQQFRGSTNPASCQAVAAKGCPFLQGTTSGGGDDGPDTPSDPPPTLDAGAGG